MLAIGSASWTFVLCALPTIPLVFYLHGILGRSPFDFFTSPQVEFFILQKTVTFCENCRSFVGGFPWNSVWNLTFALFLVKKQQKKHDVLFKKNRYVFWKLSFFCGWFPLNSGWNLTFRPFLWSKNMTYLTKKPLRFVKFDVFLWVAFPEILYKI